MHKQNPAGRVMYGVEWWRSFLGRTSHPIKSQTAMIKFLPKSSHLLKLHFFSAGCGRFLPAIWDIVLTTQSLYLYEKVRNMSHYWHTSHIISKVPGCQHSVRPRTRSKTRKGRRQLFLVKGRHCHAGVSLLCKGESVYVLKLSLCEEQLRNVKSISSYRMIILKKILDYKSSNLFSSEAK